MSRSIKLGLRALLALTLAVGLVTQPNIWHETGWGAGGCDITTNRP